MIFDLGGGKHVAVHSHSGKVWLSAYNGAGTVNPLDPVTAKRLSKALWRAAVQSGNETLAHVAQETDR